MNKVIKWILISSGILMVVGVVMIFIGKMFGGNVSYSLPLNMGSFYESYTDENFVSEVYDLGDFSSLDVSTSFVDIEIEKGTKSQLEVLVPEGFLPEISEEGDMLKIKQPNQNMGIQLNSVTKNPVYKITISTDDVLAASIASTSGDITIAGVNIEGEIASTSGDLFVSDTICDSLTACSTSGDKDMENCEMGYIELSGTSGNTKLSNIKTEKVKNNSTSGEFYASSSEIDELEMTSTSGDIYFDELTAQNISIGGNSSTVSLFISGNAEDYDYDIVTTSGDIDIDGIEVEGKYRTSGNKPGSINISTTSGDVDISF